MHFCTNCHNMYYLKFSDKEEEENSLIYYCRNCGNEDKTIISENVCVSETQLRRSEQKYTHMVNEYTKYDPTLPRINTIKCPNQECSSNTGQSGGVGTGTGTGKIKLNIKKKTVATMPAQAQAEPAQAQAQAQAPEPELEPEPAYVTTKSNQQKVNEVKSLENEHSNREIIYIRYDDINMKYVYLCVHCDTIWKTDNRL